MPKSTVYVLELAPPAGDDKPHLALRRLLKYAWRCLGWKCLGVSEKPAEPRQRPRGPLPDSAGEE